MQQRNNVIYATLNSCTVQLMKYSQTKVEQKKKSQHVIEWNKPKM